MSIVRRRLGFAGHASGVSLQGGLFEVANCDLKCEISKITICDLRKYDIAWIINKIQLCDHKL